MSVWTNAVESETAKTLQLIWGIFASIILVLLIVGLVLVVKKIEAAGALSAFYVLTVVYVFISALWWFGYYGNSTAV